jgi:phosphoglycerate dehydrogenase-like enzyme
VTDRPVVLSQLGRTHSERLAEAFPQIEVVPALVDDDLPDRADVLVNAPWGRDLLPRLVAETGVGWVHTVSTGVDKLDLDLFRDGPVLTCSRGASAVPIAEWVLAQMLAFEKDLPDSWITEPPEQWNLADLGTLDGRRVGLVGLGAIGSAVAARATAFGCELRAVRRTDTPSDIVGLDVTTDLPALVAWCDHLVLAAAATPDTRHLINADVLADIGPGAHLVNIARGSLVDQEALRLALDDGRVARASLDVVDPEPLPIGHWLFGHPAVRVSAHVSWSAPRSWERLVDGFHTNLRRWLAGAALDGIVDLDAGY